MPRASHRIEENAARLDVLKRIRENILGASHSMEEFAPAAKPRLLRPMMARVQRYRLIPAPRKAKRSTSGAVAKPG